MRVTNMVDVSPRGDAYSAGNPIADTMSIGTCENNCLRWPFSTTLIIIIFVLLVLANRIPPKLFYPDVRRSGCLMSALNTKYSLQHFKKETDRLMREGEKIDNMSYDDLHDYHSNLIDHDKTLSIYLSTRVSSPLETNNDKSVVGTSTNATPTRNTDSTITKNHHSKARNAPRRPSVARQQLGTTRRSNGPIAVDINEPKSNDDRTICLEEDTTPGNVARVSRQAVFRNHDNGCLDRTSSATWFEHSGDKHNFRIRAIKLPNNVRGTLYRTSPNNSDGHACDLQPVHGRMFVENVAANQKISIRDDEALYIKA